MFWGKEASSLKDEPPSPLAILGIEASYTKDDPPTSVSFGKGSFVF